MSTRALLASWRTTVGGLIAGAVMILQQLGPLFDSDPATNPDWNVVVAGIGIIWMAIVARDNAVNSRQAGAE